MKYRYCAVVVLYNPELDVIENLQSYSKYYSKIYIIDNSTTVNTELVEKIKKLPMIRYISMNGNQGLAIALSYGCKMAIEDGFDYIATMDQDSKFEDGANDLLIDYIENCNENKIAIVAPSVIALETEKNGNTKEIPLFVFDEKTKEFPWVMTSGSVMQLRAYQEVGGFDEKLFVDHIDIDIGIKFFQGGYKIIRLKDAIIYQHLGHAKTRKFLGKEIHPNFDNPVRTYYIARNQHYLMKKYGCSYRKFTNVSYLKMILKIMLYENEKKEKLLMFFRGLYDGYKGFMGKCRFID